MVVSSRLQYLVELSAGFQMRRRTLLLPRSRLVACTDWKGKDYLFQGSHLELHR